MGQKMLGRGCGPEGGGVRQLEDVGQRIREGNRRCGAED